MCWKPLYLLVFFAFVKKSDAQEFSGGSVRQRTDGLKCTG